MVKSRTIKGTLEASEEYESGNYDLTGIIEFNGEDCHVRVSVNNIIEQFMGKNIEIAIKVIEG